jgi:tetratricopeptide (TPR) repeat protein
MGAVGALAFSLPAGLGVFGQTAGWAPADPQSQMAKAEGLLEERRPAEALAILENLLRENPELPGTRYQAALAAQRSGDSAKASQLAAEALERKEDTSELQVLIGVMAMQEKNYPEARSAFELAVKLDPASGIALYNLSEALRAEGRPQEAIAKLEKAIELEPERNLLQLKLRLAQMETDQGYEEIEKEVISRQNDEAPTEDWLMTAAAVHLKRGNYRQAGEALRSAKAVAGSNEVRAIFAEDTFFRQFADDRQLADIREELGLE